MQQCRRQGQAHQLVRVHRILFGLPIVENSSRPSTRRNRHHQARARDWRAPTIHPRTWFSLIIGNAALLKYLRKRPQNTLAMSGRIRTRSLRPASIRLGLNGQGTLAATSCSTNASSGPLSLDARLARISRSALQYQTAGSRNPSIALRLSHSVVKRLNLRCRLQATGYRDRGNAGWSCKNRIANRKKLRCGTLP